MKAASFPEATERLRNQSTSGFDSIAGGESQARTNAKSKAIRTPPR